MPRPPTLERAVRDAGASPRCRVRRSGAAARRRRCPASGPAGAPRRADHGRRLAGLGERRERVSLPPDVAPGRRDRDDLLVQPSGARSEQRQPPDEHDAGLRQVGDDRRDPADGGPESLARESRDQALDQPMLQMELDHVLRLGLALADAGRLEDEAAHGRPAPPARRSRGFPGTARPKLVEQRRPARVLGEGRRVGIQPDGFGDAEGAGFERGAVVLERDLHDLPDVAALDADAPARLLQQPLQPVLLVLEARDAPIGLVAQLRARATATPIRGSAADRGGQACGLATAGCRSRVSAFSMRCRGPRRTLRARGGSTSVLRTSASRTRSSSRCVVDEVAAGHDLRRLQLAVDAAVALLQTRRVPGQVDMDEIVAARLEIEPFARGIRADEDPHRFVSTGALNAILIRSRSSRLVCPVKTRMRPLEVETSSAAEAGPP